MKSINNITMLVNVKTTIFKLCVVYKLFNSNIQVAPPLSINPFPVNLSSFYSWPFLLFCKCDNALSKCRQRVIYVLKKAS